MDKAHTIHNIRIAIGIMILSFLFLVITSNAVPVEKINIQFDENGGDLTSADIGYSPSQHGAGYRIAVVNETVHNINMGTNYSNIQEAINDANTGDEIHVDSGIYYENLTVNKTLILKGKDVGNGKPVLYIDCPVNLTPYPERNAVSANRSCYEGITLNADGITVDGFVITRDSIGPSSGIRVRSNNTIITNNHITNYFYGILIDNTSNNIITDNTVTSNYFESLLIRYSNGNIVNDNNFDSNGMGYPFYNGSGIILTNSDNNEIRNNFIRFNNERGITLRRSDDNILLNNSVILDGIGITLNISNNNNVSGNTIKWNNIFGLNLTSSDTNFIYNNYFDNSNNYEITNSTSNWNITGQEGINIIGGPYLGGNFWANPGGTGFSQTCTDVDVDGICDSSYILDPNNVDYMPLSVNIEPFVEINITKYKDLNADGTRNIGEPVLSDWNFTITDNNSNDVCAGMTDASGNFNCWINTSYNPPPYTLVEETKPEWASTTPNPLIIFPFFTPVNINFGNMVSTGVINGTKFNDSNGNRIRDVDESSLPGVTIKLTRLIAPHNEQFVGLISTDSNGGYIFNDLLPGFYKVEELPLTDWSQTYPVGGSPHFINLSEGEVKEDVDFGNRLLISGEIRGVKFNDSNGNGLQDSGETGMSGISICISPYWRCTITSSSGDYNFPHIPPGTYMVYEILPSGQVATTPSMVTVTMNSGEVKIVNFGNRLLIPPPEDISVAQQSGTQNGVPTVFRPTLTVLTIRKNLTNVSNNVEAVNLILNWSDGTTRTANMAQIDATNVWEANFSAPFPGGTARMRFEVDVAPAGAGPEDAIEIGDLIFIDPSGQIRSACTGAPIIGANVTLLVEYPPTTGNFIISPPENQEPSTNPQITGVDGKYSWLTVPGTYKVKAEYPGYITAESLNVSVPPPVFDLDISLISTGGCVLPSVRYINGSVRDSITEILLSGVTISTTDISTASDSTGFYSLAVAEGVYDITATLDLRYYTNITTISTIEKAVIMQDIKLIEKPTGNITGSVRR